jgi:hypothetical protein
VCVSEWVGEWALSCPPPIALLRVYVRPRLPPATGVLTASHLLVARPLHLTGNPALRHTQTHARAVLAASAPLRSLARALCPRQLPPGAFWTVYFVLLLPNLPAAAAAALGSPAVETVRAPPAPV